MALFTVSGNTIPWLPGKGPAVAGMPSPGSGALAPVSIPVQFGQVVELGYAGGTVATVSQRQFTDGGGQIGTQCPVALPVNPGGTITVSGGPAGPTCQEKYKATFYYVDGSTTAFEAVVGGTIPVPASAYAASFITDAGTSVKYLYSGTWLWSNPATNGAWVIASTPPQHDCAGEPGRPSLPGAAGGNAVEGNATIGCLLASFADANGNVIEVHAPGNGATLVVPQSATQLLLGVNVDTAWDSASWVTANGLSFGAGLTSLNWVGSGTTWPSAVGAWQVGVLIGAPSGLNVQHGANCHNYLNGSPIAPSFPPGNGALFKL